MKFIIFILKHMIYKITKQKTCDHYGLECEERYIKKNSRCLLNSSEHLRYLHAFLCHYISKSFLNNRKKMHFQKGVRFNIPNKRRLQHIHKVLIFRTKDSYNTYTNVYIFFLYFVFHINDFYSPTEEVHNSIFYTILNSNCLNTQAAVVKSQIHSTCGKIKRLNKIMKR